MRVKEAFLRAFGLAKDHAYKLPYVPNFLRKEPGILLSMGQFNQWAGGQIMGQGVAQIWPGTPVAGPLMQDRAVTGVRLQDQGVDKAGRPEAGFMPGMDIISQLTVVADGPVGAVGRKLDETLGLPEGNHRAGRWAVGMKMVVDLPEGCTLKEGTVLHTLGYPEPEIFGFLYVYPGNVASLGIFVPSWFDSPVRTAYRYLQHWMQHPALWKHLKGGRMRSWGAKSLQESGRKGEPHLVGDGFARIGEGSGTTNVLTGSGFDEAWTSGVLLGVSVLELLKADKPFSKENLEATYVRRRRDSWLEREGRIAEKARDGFQAGIIQGLIGMALTGFTDGKINWPGASKKPHERIPSIESFFQGRIPASEIAAIRRDCTAEGSAALRRAHGPRGLARHRVRRPAAGLAPGRPAHGRQGAGPAGLPRPRDLQKPRACARPATRRSASRPAPARPSPPTRKAARRSSTGRSACTAGPASGTAASPRPRAGKAPMWIFRPGRAGCTRRRTNSRVNRCPAPDPHPSQTFCMGGGWDKYVLKEFA